MGEFCAATSSSLGMRGETISWLGRGSLLPRGATAWLRRPGEELGQYPAECGLVGRRQALAEQRRHQLQVRFDGSQQGSPPIVGDRDLNTAPVVVGCAARDQTRLLHPGEQSAHTAFAEQHAIPQLFLT